MQPFLDSSLSSFCQSVNVKENRRGNKQLVCALTDKELSLSIVFSNLIFIIILDLSYLTMHVELLMIQYETMPRTTDMRSLVFYTIRYGSILIDRQENL